MSDTYSIQCNCGTVKMTLTGEPKVRGVCHCEDCRELLESPFMRLRPGNRNRRS
jgi:hypothetical protein